MYPPLHNQSAWRDILKNAIKLNHDNFTPLSRTPWAGDAIVTKIKGNLPRSSTSQDLVGESWEFSCDKDFPSILAGSDIPLLALMEQYSDEVFGKGADKNCEILVKYVNANQPLSLQLHPRDDDPNLKNNECGKPETWLILDAKPGCGIYLGFNKAFSAHEIEAALRAPDDSAKELLQFVPVKAGDYFEIEPHVPHAIGPGVLLAEPQRVRQGKSGKTYRLWDWGRRYNAAGNLDMQRGETRPLHLKEALPLLNPSKQYGIAYVDTLRRTPQRKELAPGITVDVFPKNESYQVSLLHAANAGRFSWQSQSYQVMLVTQGEVDIRSNTSKTSLRAQGGETALLPALTQSWELQLQTDTQIMFVKPV